MKSRSPRASSSPKSHQEATTATATAPTEAQVPVEPIHLDEKFGVYDGEADLKTKKKCGNGTLKFNSTGEEITCGMRSYTGKWLNDFPNGKGAIEWKNGLCKLKGEFRNGQATGHGCVKFKDGTTSVQWWRAGVAVQVINTAAPEPPPHPTLAGGFPLKEALPAAPTKSPKTAAMQPTTTTTTAATAVTSTPIGPLHQKMHIGEFQSRLVLWGSLNSHFDLGYLPMVWTVQILVKALDSLAHRDIEALILTAIDASVPSESGLVLTFLDPEGGRFCTLWDVINQSTVLEKAVEMFCKNGPSKDFTLDKMRKIFRSSSAFSWSGRELLPFIETIYEMRDAMKVHAFPDNFKLSIAIAAGKAFAMFRRLSVPALQRALARLECSELQDPQAVFHDILKLPELARERNKLEHASRNMDESFKSIKKVLSGFASDQGCKKVYPIGMRFLAKFFVVLSACTVASKVNRALNWCRILGVYMPLASKVSQDDSKLLTKWFSDMIDMIEAELSEIKSLMEILNAKSKSPEITSNSEILAETVGPGFVDSPKRVETNLTLLRKSVDKITVEPSPAKPQKQQEQKSQSYSGYVFSLLSYFFSSSPAPSEPQEKQKEPEPEPEPDEKAKKKKKNVRIYSPLDDGLVPLNRDMIAFLNSGNIWSLEILFESCDNVIGEYASRLISTIELTWRKDLAESFLLEKRKSKTTTDDEAEKKKKDVVIEFDKKYSSNLIAVIMKSSAKGVMTTKLCNNSYKLLSSMLAGNDKLIEDFMSQIPPKGNTKTYPEVLLDIASRSPLIREHALKVLSVVAQSIQSRTRIYSTIGIKKLYEIAQQAQGEEEGKGVASSKLAMQVIGYLCYDQNCLHEAIGTGILPVLFECAKSGKILLHTQIHAKDITLEKELGRGAYATVYKGRWAGRDVAVKVFSESSFQFRLEDFLQEVAIMSTFRHPNLMAMYGAVVERSRDAESKFMIVTELLGSSLQHILFSNNIGFLPELILEYALNISAAMAYLHSFNMIHRDLKSANILIAPDGSVRVCDLGLSRIVSKLSMTMCAGTPKWEAPECIESSTYSTAADVYSFGMVLWEMKTAKEPFPEVTSFVELKKLVCDKKKRPDIPQDTPRWLKDLMKACWAHNPKKRPSFDDIHKALSALKSNPKEMF